MSTIQGIGDVGPKNRFLTFLKERRKKFQDPIEMHLGFLGAVLQCGQFLASSVYRGRDGGPCIFLVFSIEAVRRVLVVIPLKYALPPSRVCIYSAVGVVCVFIWVARLCKKERGACLENLAIDSGEKLQAEDVGQLGHSKRLGRLITSRRRRCPPWCVETHCARYPVST